MVSLFSSADTIKQELSLYICGFILIDTLLCIKRLYYSKIHWSINSMICINKEKAHGKGSIHQCGSADNMGLILVSVAQEWQSPQKSSFLQRSNRFIIIITEKHLNRTLHYPVANIEIHFHHLHKKQGMSINTRDNKKIAFLPFLQSKY